MGKIIDFQILAHIGLVISLVLVLLCFFVIILDKKRGSENNDNK